jgi:predicted ATPase/DNA-binding winged helix-turn-helix (wHTH) protein
MESVAAICFGQFALDLRRGCLRHDDTEIKLRPKGFEVLRYLVENAGRLVPKDEIMRTVWPNVTVSDESLARCISDIRLALLDRGQQIIRTVPRRGYLLAVPTVEGEQSAMPEREVATGLSDVPRTSDPLSVLQPPAEPAPVSHNNLPQPANALIGRERDVAEIEALLSRYRLVTLVGAAGVGKTSLSLRVGADLLARFPDGARFVELAPLDRAELIGETVAAAFGLPVHGGRPATDAIATYLRSRRVLLILDNCEHVITAAARLADGLLKTCPGVLLLATSREALSVAGEHAYPVPLLDVPPRSANLTAAWAMEHSAVHLFVERAAAALGCFSLTDETAPIVAEICRRLDGIPLAIELAAPRLKVLTPEALQARLDDQLHLLTAGSRTAVPRQQTLRAAIEWSYALLSEAEQAMLQRLAVFAGSFTLEAVAAVVTGSPVEAPDVLNVLAGLVDKSLVVSLASAGENRYRLLESTRAFVREKLAVGGYATLARRMCEHMAIVFERADRTCLTTPTADWLAAYEPDLDNLRAALGWSLGPEGDPALGLKLVGYTHWVWRELSLVEELRRWFELALTFVDSATPPSVEARMRLGLGWDFFGGERDRLPHNLRAIELLRQVGGEPILLGQALVQAGQATIRDVTEVTLYVDEALSVLRPSARTKLLAYALMIAAGCRMNGGIWTLRGPLSKRRWPCAKQSGMPARTTPARRTSLLSHSRPAKWRKPLAARDGQPRRPAGTAI